MQVTLTQQYATSTQMRGYLLVIFSVAIFACEAVTLRYAAKYGLPTGPIAISQCVMAAAVQLFFGARFSRVDWRRWWPALITTTFNGLAFYLAIRLTPAAIVGLIEPLGLVPLMLGHRFILNKRLSLGCGLALTMLLISCITTVGQWPESITLLAILVSIVGVICSGLALVTGEAVPSDGVPSFVLAMQVILAIFSVGLTFILGSSNLAGQSNSWPLGIAVGAGTGLFVGLAVSALFHGVQHLGALKAGTIKILRLPTIAILAYFFINESATLISAIALSAVVIFSILAVYLSREEEINNK